MRCIVERNNIRSLMMSGSGDAFFSSDERERRRKRLKFFERMQSFPPEAQEMISNLSSVFLEPDEYRKFRNDSKRLLGIRTELKGYGMEEKDVDDVMNFFNFPASGRKQYGKRP